SRFARIGQAEEHGGAANAVIAPGAYPEDIVDIADLGAEDAIQGIEMEVVAPSEVHLKVIGLVRLVAVEFKSMRDPRTIGREDAAASGHASGEVARIIGYRPCRRQDATAVVIVISGAKVENHISCEDVGLEAAGGNIDGEVLAGMRGQGHRTEIEQNLTDKGGCFVSQLVGRNADLDGGVGIVTDGGDELTAYNFQNRCGHTSIRTGHRSESQQAPGDNE